MIIKVTSDQDLKEPSADADAQSWHFILDSGVIQTCQLSGADFLQLVSSKAITLQTKVAHASYTFGEFRTAGEVPPVCRAVALCCFASQAERVTESVPVSVDQLRSKWYATSLNKEETPFPNPKVIIAVAAVLGGIFLCFTFGAGSLKSRSDYSVPPSRYYDTNYRPLVGEEYIRTYTKGDGTRVEGHFRTRADNSFYNNYSSKGNINPHTGEVGSRRP